jgi:hypothetical protein
MLFNATLQDFFTTVAAGKWEIQQPQAVPQLRPTAVAN